MNYAQLIERLQNRTIDIDLNGHSVGFLEHVIAIVLAYLESAQKHLNNTNNIVEDSGAIYLLSSVRTCFNCGERLELFYRDDKLVLDYYTDKWHVCKSNKPCEFSGIKSVKNSIKVNSALVFANYFYDREKRDYLFPDAPDGEKYSKLYDLNSIRGRIGIAKYKAETHNVAYGQMGNMTIGVFVHPNKKSIIITSPYNGYDDIKIVEDHVFAGSICLSVWRWEAADLNSVGPDPNRYTTDEDAVVCHVEHGVWDFEHFYCLGNWEDFHNDEEQYKPHVYSRFTLRE